MFNSSARESISTVDYQQIWLGKWSPQCAVQDLYGNHCPDEATQDIEIDGVKFALCKRCYANYQAGAYSRRKIRGNHLYIS